jgi:hypothetical protein
MGFLAKSGRVLSFLAFLVLIGLASGLQATPPDEHGGEGFAVSGVVVTTDGAAVPGVIVDLVGGEKKMGTVSDSDGAFSFAAVQPGDYTVEFKATGKKKAKLKITVADADVDMGNVTLK